MKVYRDDYPKEPIGRGNPYYRCVHCKLSAPLINGEIGKHASWCEWRIEQEIGKESKRSSSKLEDIEEVIRDYNSKTSYSKEELEDILCEIGMILEYN